jgi:HoxN/HupN/NixA family high-affinity nickel-transporter
MQIVYRSNRRPAGIGLHFSRTECRRLCGFYGFIVLFQVVGWGLYLHYAASHPALVGLGFVAYMFGLRQAFDADHIAAIDDTVRYLLQKGKRPLGVGFFFSLGHSTVVLVLAIAIAFAATTTVAEIPQIREIGSLAGTAVSGAFVWLIGALNILVLLDILGVWRAAKAGTRSHEHLEAPLAKRGLLDRLFGGRLAKVINHSWQLYPLGVLFGLGFDTASEVALLAMMAGAAAGNLPIPAVLCLPILFAAGMSIMDTTDGVLMSKAYNWALQSLAQDLLQPRDDRTVDCGRAGHWQHRARTGADPPHGCGRRRVRHDRRARFREARLSHRRPVSVGLGFVGCDLEARTPRAAISGGRCDARAHAPSQRRH